jgi:tRNA modification GTPase
MALSYPTDTIAAIATAPGEGAIAIVRVSGPATYALADRLFRCPAPLPSARAPGTFAHGQVVDFTTGDMLDDALMLIFRAPHSYTGEHSVEIQCHGGSQAAQRILAALLAAGARQAEPGEFTKRAFLNDKLDLTQAEAVLDLIHARSERAARLATAQLEDALGLRIRALYDSLLATSADVEAMLDFPDDELPQTVPAEVSGRLSVISTEIQALLDTWHEGHVLREGARIVIAGAPNVGKSTLLNRLAGRDRAIVSPHPGTTRDTIEEFVTLQGYPMQLIDTAGLRDAPCEIEKEGIRRTHHALAQADLCLCLVDASKDLSAEEKSFLAAHDPKKLIVLLNKIDLGQKIHPNNVPGIDSMSISLQKSPPIGRIIEIIVQKVVQKPSDGDHGVLAISERHKNMLSNALEDVKNAEIYLNSGLEADFLPAATHARSALDQIGYIFGKNCTEEMLDSIFSRFCVGK